MTPAPLTSFGLLLFATVVDAVNGASRRVQHRCSAFNHHLHNDLSIYYPMTTVHHLLGKNTMVVEPDDCTQTRYAAHWVPRTPSPRLGKTHICFFLACSWARVDSLWWRVCVLSNSIFLVHLNLFSWPLWAKRAIISGVPLYIHFMWYISFCKTLRLVMTAYGSTAPWEGRRRGSNILSAWRPSMLGQAGAAFGVQPLLPPPHLHPHHLYG